MADKVKKLQTVVPIAAARKVESLAESEGGSASAWLRRLILKTLKMSGTGKKVRKK